MFIRKGLCAERMTQEWNQDLGDDLMTTVLFSKMTAKHPAIRPESERLALRKENALVVARLGILYQHITQSTAVPPHSFAQTNTTPPYYTV